MSQFQSTLFQQPELYGQQDIFSGAGKVGDAIIKGVDFITKLPSDVAREADRINSDVARILQDFQGRAAGTARQNLTGGVVGGWGRQAADWVNSNRLLAGIGAALAVLLIARGVMR